MPQCIRCNATGKAIYPKDNDKNGKCKYCDGTGWWEKDTPV